MDDAVADAIDILRVAQRRRAAAGGQQVHDLGDALLVVVDRYGALDGLAIDMVAGLGAAFSDAFDQAGGSLGALAGGGHVVELVFDG